MRILGGDSDTSSGETASLQPDLQICSSTSSLTSLRWSSAPTMCTICRTSIERRPNAGSRPAPYHSHALGERRRSARVPRNA